MTAVALEHEDTASPAYYPAEHHLFETGGNQFLYLVPSGAIFGLSGLSRDIFNLLQSCPLSHEELTEELVRRGYASDEIESTLDEMVDFDVLSSGVPKKTFPSVPDETFPIQRIVLNTTNQCNLACGYCYEYSEDKIATTKDKPKFMSDSIARAAIDTLFKESAGRTSLHVTFFGGETLLNFPLMRESCGVRDIEGRARRARPSTSASPRTPHCLPRRSPTFWPNTASASRSASTAIKNCTTICASSIAAGKLRHHRAQN